MLSLDQKLWSLIKTQLFLVKLIVIRSIDLYHETIDIICNNRTIFPLRVLPLGISLFCDLTYLAFVIVQSVTIFSLTIGIRVKITSLISGGQLYFN